MFQNAQKLFEVKNSFRNDKHIVKYIIMLKMPSPIQANLNNIDYSKISEDNESQFE